MLFENPPFDINNLPSTEELDYQSLEANYLKVKTINLIIVFIIIGVGLFVTTPNIGLENFYFIIIGIGWLTLAVVSVVIMRKAFNFKKFALRSKDVIYRKGWIWKKTTIVPFSRVQHCELSQGPIEKHFGLAKLNVFTAGGQSSDLVIPGLTFDRANQIKEFLINKINAEDNSH